VILVDVDIGPGAPANASTTKGLSASNASVIMHGGSIRGVGQAVLAWDGRVELEDVEISESGGAGRQAEAAVYALGNGILTMRRVSIDAGDGYGLTAWRGRLEIEDVEVAGRVWLLSSRVVLNGQVIRDAAESPAFVDTWTTWTGSGLEITGGGARRAGARPGGLSRGAASGRHGVDQIGLVRQRLRLRRTSPPSSWGR
jgi:hypothetical protein